MGRPADDWKPLGEGVYERLAARGIDLAASHAGFLAEVRLHGVAVFELPAARGQSKILRVLLPQIPMAVVVRQGDLDAGLPPREALDASIGRRSASRIGRPPGSR